jgi:hypothetical protein
MSIRCHAEIWLADENLGKTDEKEQRWRTSHAVRGIALMPSGRGDIADTNGGGFLALATFSGRVGAT